MKTCIRTLLLVGQPKAAAEPLSLASLASSPNGGALGKEGQLLRAPQDSKTPPTPCQKHSIEGGLFSKSRFHSGLSLKADNGGHPRCDTQLPAACCPGALHAAVCKQASSQRPVLSAQTMQRYSARINAFILLQAYYNSRRGVSQAFDSPARLVLHWAKMQPGGFIMQLITERLFLIPLLPDGMRALPT